MFSQVSVSHSVHRWWWTSLVLCPFWGSDCVQEAAGSRAISIPPTPTRHWILWDTVDKRAVCILLECFLVIKAITWKKVWCLLKAEIIFLNTTVIILMKSSTFLTFYCWWLIQLSYWFKGTFLLRSLGILTKRNANYSFWLLWELLN